MYADIGKKIKGLAKWTFIIEAILLVVLGMVLIATNVVFYDAYYYYNYEFWIGIGFTLLGPIFAWFSSWVLYGFGEIIDKVTEIARNTKRSGEIKSEVQTKHENDKIAKLEELRTAGLITEEEYQESVSKI